MATVIDRIATVGASFVEITYDDVTLDFTVVNVHAAVPCFFLIARGNNTAWREGTIAAGDYSHNSGGPVRNLADVPHWSFGEA